MTVKNCWTVCRFVRVILVQNAMESQVQTGMNCGMIAANNSSHSSSEICSKLNFLPSILHVRSQYGFLCFNFPRQILLTSKIRKLPQHKHCFKRGAFDQAQRCTCIRIEPAGPVCTEKPTSAKVQCEIESAAALFLNLRASKYIEFHVSCDVN